jgi:hypothetical protein
MCIQGATPADVAYLGHDNDNALAIDIIASPDLLIPPFRVGLQRNSRDDLSLAGERPDSFGPASQLQRLAARRTAEPMITLRNQPT